MLRYPEGGEESVVSVNEITAAHHVRLASTLVDREEMLLLVGKVIEALKPESPSSEKDRSDALLFCLDSRGKMILTGVQEDLSLESAGEQSTIIMTMNIRTPGASLSCQVFSALLIGRPAFLNGLPLGFLLDVSP